MSAHKAISTMLVCFVLKTYVGHFVDNLGFPGKLLSCAHKCNFGKEARRHNYWPLQSVKNNSVQLTVILNEAKRYAKQLQFEVINALASDYCYFLQAELNGYQRKQQELQRSIVNCRTVVKIISFTSVKKLLPLSG